MSNIIKLEMTERLLDQAYARPKDKKIWKRIRRLVRQQASANYDERLGKIAKIKNWR